MIEKEPIPSSRNRATSHRGVAFHGFESLILIFCKKKNHTIWCGFLFGRG